MQCFIGMKTPLRLSAFSQCASLLAPALLALFLGLPSLDLGAATILYYRFEAGGDGPLSDSSGNNLDLTAQNSAGAVPIPGTGQGSDFPSTVLSQSNAQMARTLDGGSSTTRQTFITGDDPLLDFGSTITIEMLLNLDTGATVPGDGTSDYMVGLYGNATANQAFGVGIINDGGTLRPRAVFGDGSTINAQTFSSLSLSAGTDYFLAVTYSSGTTNAYLTDLSTNIQTTQQLSFTNYNLADSGVGLRIGGLSSSGAGNAAGSVFSGYLDEVRISDVALAPSQFLIPEPGTSALLAVAGLALAFVRRRAGSSRN